MATLKLGRLTLDTVNTVVESSDGVTRKVAMAGDAIGSTLAATRNLRDELMELPRTGNPIAVTWSEDASYDAFYSVKKVQAETVSLTGVGFVQFQIEMELFGRESEVEFQSVLTGFVATNGGGVTDAESEKFLGMPLDYYSITDLSALNTANKITRSGVDGSVAVYPDVFTDYYPRWAVAPADFYKHAAQISVDSQVRVGEYAPNTPATWELSNGLVRISPNATNGRLDVEHYDGAAWDTAKVWKFEAQGFSSGAFTEAGAWESITIIRNTPEECVIRLDQSVTGDSTNYVDDRQSLDIALRRGSRFASFTYTWGSFANLSTSTAYYRVRLVTGEAGTAVTPTGATGTMAVRATSNDASGNRYVIGTTLNETTTFDTTNGGFETTTYGYYITFFIGSEVGGSGAATYDAASPLCLQWLGAMGENVKAIKR